MKKSCLCILCIMVWMCVCLILFSATCICQMLRMNARWMHGDEWDLPGLYCSFINCTKPMVSMNLMESRLTTYLVLENWYANTYEVFASKSFSTLFLKPWANNWFQCEDLNVLVPMWGNQWNFTRNITSNSK